MSNYDSIATFLLMVALICLAYYFGYSDALKQLKGRVDKLAQIIETRRDSASG